MKRMRPIFREIICAAGLIVPAAAGASEPIHGTYGYLIVSGSMSEPSCRLSMDSTVQTVDLGSVPSTSLLKQGSASRPATFAVRLENCSRKAGSMIDEGNNTRSWSSMQPLVALTFNGTADVNSPHLFSVSGAKGVGLRISEMNGRQVVPGQRGTPHFVSPGQEALYWQAQLERTAGDFQPNSWRATLDFLISYF